jgi:hypothetical protein
VTCCQPSVTRTGRFDLWLFGPAACKEWRLDFRLAIRQHHDVESSVLRHFIAISLNNFHRTRNVT